MNRMRACQHCNESFELAATGRPPKFCSATCRKAAWEAEKLRQAVAVATAKAVAAERRRMTRAANRGNETPEPSGNRGNETPPAAPEASRSVRPAVRPGTPRGRRPLLPPPPGRVRGEQLPLDGEG